MTDLSALIEVGSVSHRAALLKNKQNVGLYEIRAAALTLFPGQRMQAIMGAIDRRLGGAFVKFSDGTIGFLPVKENQGLSEGQKIIVAIKKVELAPKRPIVRLVLDEPDQSLEMASPLQGLLDYFCALGIREIATNQPHVFSKIFSATGLESIRVMNRQEVADIDDYFDQARHHKVELESGASLVFDELEALCAIDFNLGHSGGQSKRGAIIKSVKAALPELVSHIKSRRLGGQIIIDFPREAVAAKEEICAFCKKHLPAPAKIGPFLGSGLLHLTIPKYMPSLLHSCTQETQNIQPGRKIMPWVLLAQAVRTLEKELAQDRGAHFTFALAPALFASHEENMAWVEKTERQYGSRCTIVRAVNLGEKKWEIEKREG